MSYLLALRAMPWKLIGVCALGLAFFALVAALKIERAHSAKLSARIVACSEARKADRSAYEKAQAEAQAKNQAHVAKIEQQQQEITDDVARNLNARLAALREQLRPQNGTAQGSAGKPGAPSLPVSGPSTPPASGLCLAPDQLLRGAENEERHEQLIRWVEQQLKVNPNK